MDMGDDDADDDDAAMEVDDGTAANNNNTQRPQPPQEPEYPPAPPPAEGRTIPRPRMNPLQEIDRYKSTLLKFMSYKDKVACMMCFKVFGKEDPGPDDRPLFAMQNAIKGWKKHISYFMIDHISPWNEQARTGNPTRSTILNDLISIVGTKETRGLGLPSNQDRPFQPHEFEQILSKLRSSDDFNLRYRYSSMLLFMLHLVARGDDAAHVYKSTLRASTVYPGVLTTRLRWSKNVRERRDCPPQIMLGSMNPVYCVMLSIAIFLEHWLGSGAGVSSQWLFAEGITTPQSSIKDMDKEADNAKGGL